MTYELQQLAQIYDILRKANRQGQLPILPENPQIIRTRVASPKHRQCLKLLAKAARFFRNEAIRWRSKVRSMSYR